jgi:hypothetical protein
MRKVTLTKSELAVLNATIETLQQSVPPRALAVQLDKLAPAMLTTVVIDATKVVGAGTRILPEDAKILAKIGKLAGKLQTKMSLADLIKLRKSAITE